MNIGDYNLLQELKKRVEELEKQVEELKEARKNGTKRKRHCSTDKG